MRWAGKIELHMVEKYMFLCMLSVHGIAQQGGGGPYMLYIPYELVFLFLACYNSAILPRRGHEDLWVVEDVEILQSGAGGIPACARVVCLDDSY